jgi:hypothetical protein
MDSSTDSFLGADTIWHCIAWSPTLSHDAQSMSWVQATKLCIHACGVGKQYLDAEFPSDDCWAATSALGG